MLVCLESTLSPCKPGRLYWQCCYTFSDQETHEESTTDDGSEVLSAGSNSTTVYSISASVAKTQAEFCVLVFSPRTAGPLQLLNASSMSLFLPVTISTSILSAIPYFKAIFFFLCPVSVCFVSATSTECLREKSALSSFPSNTVLVCSISNMDGC